FSAACIQTDKIGDRGRATSREARSLTDFCQHSIEEDILDQDRPDYYPNCRFYSTEPTTFYSTSLFPSPAEHFGVTSASIHIPPIDFSDWIVPPSVQHWQATQSRSPIISGTERPSLALSAEPPKLKEKPD